MPTIRVNTDILKDIEDEIYGVISNLKLIQTEFCSISRNIDWEIKDSFNIDSRIRGVEQKLSAELIGLEKMMTFLGNACLKYDDTDKNGRKNIGEKVNNSSYGGLFKISTDYNESSSKNNISNNKKKRESVSKPKASSTDNLVDIAEEFGVMGLFFGANYHNAGAILGKENTKFLNSAKSQVSILGKTFEKVYDGDGWKEIFLGGVFDKGDSFKECLTNEFKEFSFKNAKNLGSGVNAGAKWAEVGFSMAINAYSNINETHNGVKNTNERIVAETLIETGVDEALYIASTAAIGAAIATAPIAVPAAAVGALAVGVTIAVNWGTEVLTSHFWGEDNKKDFKELVSDSILDGGKWVIGKVSAGWKSLFD